MIKETDFIKEYTDWIKANSAQRFVNGYTEIMTPFLDIHNDLIQFYVQKSGDEYYFTDDGYTLTDIEMNGVNLSSQRRKELVSELADLLNVKIENGAITAKANSPVIVAQTIHKMIQAILKFGDMFYLATPQTRNLFMDDVKYYFDSNDVRFTSSPMFSGRSGLPQRFDFVIPKSKKEPERMITTINRPSRQSVQSAIFAWNDIKDSRKEETISYLILNTNAKKSSVYTDAAKEYGMNAFWWDERDKYIEHLVA